jgi:ketosteroid isomerase-like protein
MSPEELRAWMEADNREWLAAFNTGQLDALVARYDEQATIVDPRAGPITGKAAVTNFWREQLQTSTDHTFEIVDCAFYPAKEAGDLDQRGDLAYQIAKWTVKLHGQRYSGYTLRIFVGRVNSPEIPAVGAGISGSDGKWLTKVHMFNLSLSPSLLWKGPLSYFGALWPSPRR